MFNEIDFSKIDTAGAPPTDDAGRQYYYMAKLATMVTLKEQELGRPITYCLQTFGCQMNEKQSEVVAGIMDEIGFKRQDTENADVVIYNTCTVRENANLKVYGRLGKLHSLKKSNPDMKIALFGCMRNRWWTRSRRTIHLSIWYSEPTIFSSSPSCSMRWRTVTAS